MSRALDQGLVRYLTDPPLTAGIPEAECAGRVYWVRAEPALERGRLMEERVRCFRLMLRRGSHALRTR